MHVVPLAVFLDEQKASLLFDAHSCFLYFLPFPNPGFTLEILVVQKTTDLIALESQNCCHRGSCSLLNKDLHSKYDSKSLHQLNSECEFESQSHFEESSLQSDLIYSNQ